MNVKSISERYISYDDGTSEKATPDALQKIMDTARRDTKFYDRMYHELSELYNKAKINLDHGTPCPTRENFIERTGALDGIRDAIKYANAKETQAIVIETHCRHLLGLKQPNINEMYPETICERRAEK